MKIIVPSLGESVTEATVAKWLKKEGEVVVKDDVLVELETDKATLEVYAQTDGILTKIYFEDGQDVQIGEELAELIEETNIIFEKGLNILTGETGSGKSLLVKAIKLLPSVFSFSVKLYKLASTSSISSKEVLS